MARTNAQLLAFNRGEVSKIALVRVDLARLQLSAECQLNWEPRVVGSMGLRPGLQYVGEVLADAPALLMDFVYAKNDTALLELTANTMRIRIDEVLLTRPSVATAISDPTFAGGGAWSLADSTSGTTATIGGGLLVLTCTPLGGLARAKQAIAVALSDQNKEHGLRVTVTTGPVTIRIGSADGLSDILAQTEIDTGTHSLSFVATSGVLWLQIDSTDQRQKVLTGCAIEAGGVVTVPTPWGANDLSNVRWTQSQDIVYVACYGIQQYKIERRGTRPGARGWSVALYRSNDGPFHARPDAAVQLRPNVLRGNGVIAANVPFFQPGHLGALLRLFTPGQANSAVIGGSNQYTLPTRISGLQGDRNVAVIVTGTWTGTVSLQRSLVGPDSGFLTITALDPGWASAPTLTGNFAITYNDDGTTASGIVYDNVVAWYRFGFEDGNYGSGSAVMQVSTGVGGGHGVARITSYGSPLLVGIEVLDPFTNGSTTDIWQISDWCPAFGWPTSVAFHDGRLWWFSGGQIPIAGSRADNYTGFAEEDRDGNALGDSAAILEAFGEGPSDAVSFGLPLTRLLCGRDGSIASIRSSSFDEPLTPTNFSVKDCSTQGAARLPAVKIDKRGIFVEQSGRRVYALEYVAQAMDYSAGDLTRLNLDVGLTGFTDVTVSRQPDTTIYLPRGDGQCAALLYDPDDEVTAWWRLQTLGTIERARRLPSKTGPEDLVYFVVKRTVNGTTRRFIERLASRQNCLGGLINQQLDCAVTYQGAPSTTVTAAHLPNTTLTIWADGVSIGTALTNGAGVATLPGGVSAANIVAGLAGSVQSYAPDTATATFPGLSAFEGLTAEVFADQQPSNRMVRVGPLTVSGGVLTLPNGWTALSIVAFFGYVAPFMSAKLAYGAQMGSALAQKKKIDHLGLVAFDTHAQGIQFGQSFDALDALPLMEGEGEVDADAVWSELDEPVVEVPGTWNTDARLCLLAQAPLPARLGACVIGMATNEKG